MSPRGLAALLLAAAGLLHAGVAAPARGEADRALLEHQRLLQERRATRARLTGLERRDAARQRAAAGSAAIGADAPELRRATLASLQGAGVSGVRLEVHPAKPPLGATLHVTAEGRSTDVLRLSGRLAGPETGLVLSRVRLSPAHDGLLTLDVEGFSLEGRP